VNGDVVRGEMGAKLWLFLLKSGGRWVASEVAARTGEDREEVRQILPAMARSENVRKYAVEGKERRFAYGVTGACKVPRFVNVQQVAECVMAQAPERWRRDRPDPPVPDQRERVLAQLRAAQGLKRAVTVVSDEAKAYKAQVRQAAVLAHRQADRRPRAHRHPALFPQRPQDWAKRARLAPLTWDDDVRCIDLDNANKVLLDALKGVAIEDDRWVRELHSQRMEPDGEARVVVTITPLALPASPQTTIFNEGVPA
jgi:crossover junction endodeoxyribonuclease RusA